MLNMLSFSEVSKHFRIIVDTALSNHINVHVTSDTVLCSTQLKDGLHLLSHTDNDNNDDVMCYSVLNLVDDNKSHYTASDIAKEDAAKKLYEHLTMPGYQKFIRLLDSNYFRNCPVTSHDVRHAIKIYGEDLAAIKGKTFRHRPRPIHHVTQLDIPPSILELYPKVVLSIDYMIVQGNTMLFPSLQITNFGLSIQSIKEKLTKKIYLPVSGKLYNHMLLWGCKCHKLIQTMNLNASVIIFALFSQYHCS